MNDNAAMRPRVFVVEDEALVAMELEDRLVGLGYDVVGTAARGEEVPDAVTRAPVDLVLMDIRLAGKLDGIETAARLRERLDVPVIFLTAYSDRETLDRATKAEPFGYLLKPFEQRELHATVQMALYKHRMDRSLREANALLAEKVAALEESERFRGAVLDSLAAHVAVLDERGTILATNAAWRRFAEENGGDPRALGEEAECLGADGRDPSPLAVGIRDVLEGRRERFEMEYPCHRPGGEERWFLARVARFEGVGAARAVVSHEDVTAVREALRALHDSEAAFATLAEASPVGIFLTDREGRCVGANQKWRQMTGLGLDDLSDGCARAVHPDDRERVRTAWEQAARTGAQLRSEYRLVRPDGKVTWVIGEAVERRNAAGDVAGYIGVVTDVTAQQQRRATLEALAELARSPQARFFPDATRRLADILRLEIAFLCELHPAKTTMRVLGLVVDGELQPDAEYELAGTPCERLIGRKTPLVLPEGVLREFPRDGWLAQLGAEGWAGVPLVDSSGQVVGHIGVMSRARLDETERLRDVLDLFAAQVASELERRRAEARFANVFGSAHDALLMVDGAGRILQANRAAETLFGYDAAELRALSVESLVPEQERGRHGAHRARFMQGGSKRLMGNERSRLRARRKDGSTVFVEIGLSPLEGERQALVVASVRDVTERVRAEEERASLEAELAEAQKMKSLGTLAGGVAHDFNNLLMAIAANVELAREDARAEGQLAESLDAIRTATARATELVQQVLTFGRKQPVSLASVDLAPLVREIHSLLKATVPPGIDLVVEIQDGAPHALANATQVHEVLMNLGTNAWQAIPRETGRVALRLEPATVGPGSPLGLAPGRYARLQVIDDGVGMDAETRARAFEPFFTTKEVGKGTGLGLAVVHGIVQGHRGAIQVDSEPGTGTTFTIYLPAAASQPTPEPAPREEGPARRARVAYVDDEVIVARATVRVLARMGYDAVGFTSAEDAMAALRADPASFEAVVVDLHMPRMSGLEIARQLAPLRPDLPVVLVSGNAPHSDAELEASNVRFRLAKPFTGASLGAVLATALKR